MKRELLKIVCTSLVAMLCLSVNGQTSGSCGANATWEYDADETTLTISGTGAMADYTDALTDNPWNDYRTSITKVVIGDDITHIGNWAFMGCTSLANVTIGEGVTSIGAEAFANCFNSSITKLNIPNSVETIGAFAFSNITNLTYVCIGSGVTSIGVDAFSTNSNLKYIGCYASNPPTLGSGAFSGVTPTAIYVPTANIGDYQTADGWSTYTAVIGYPHGNCGDSEGDATDAVTWSFDMGEYQLTLSGTGAIKTFGTSPNAYPWNNQNGPAAIFNPVVNYVNTGIQTLVVGEGITNIPDYAFHMQANLMSVSLPSTLKSIGNSAMGETAIWSIYLPEGLETIGHYAFLMSTFESISIPSTVTFIGEAAFAYGALTSIGCYASTPPTLGNNAFGDDVSGITNVYVPSAKVDTYKAASGWSAFGDKIQNPAGYCGPNDIDADGEVDETKASWSFDMATRTLTIEGTKMGQYNRPWESAGMGGIGGGFNPDNFEGYPCGIENVIIGEGITEIPGSAFYMEVGIKSVNLPSTLTAIGLDAFGECEGIETITCNATTPPTLGTDGSGVFYENDAEYNQVKIAVLTAITVPAASVTAYKAADGWNTYEDQILMPITSVGSYYWATFYDENTSYQVDANTTVYKAYLDGTTLTTTPIGGNQIITKGNAVILKSTSVPVLTVVTTESTGNFSGNSLLGSATPVAPEAGFYHYVLAYKEPNLGFYRLGSAVTIPAGKAYLKVATGGGAPARFEMTEDDDKPTEIEEVNEVKTMKPEIIYNLQGLPVNRPLSKGLYIVNGKMVYVNN